jgi:hypothetical protein
MAAGGTHGGVSGMSSVLRRRSTASADMQRTGGGGGVGGGGFLTPGGLAHQVLKETKAAREKDISGLVRGGGVTSPVSIQVMSPEIAPETETEIEIEIEIEALDLG